MALPGRGTLGTALVTVLLASGVAGCGTTGEPAACRPGDAVGEGEVVAEADLDGSGTANRITYVPPEADHPCAGRLLTTLDGEPAAGTVGDGPLDPGTARVLQLRGAARQLLMVHGPAHPRGGHIVHLVGGVGGRIGEVLAAGEPVVGFMATDGGGAPATAACTPDGGIAVLEGTTHEPPGVILAWDVWRTTYSLDGNTAVPGSRDQVREAAADPLLRREMPGLFDTGSYFADCRVP